ncbi:hypothetical protein NP493_56g07001 [Ridgeia piscesae]|uniref:Uncharacterized protein n=1 Tax=Ridgeia piscesae TaxID=27915 RepID=A0AAD9UIZ5_RIDPI|nr:hypothetical protein NP493_56g07001 [Ridgeia piscesae]
MNQNILYNNGILTIIFDILRQTFDSKLMAQYTGTQGVFKRCFTLLKLMARGNELIQKRTFDRLNMLLSIEGAVPEMADALIEITAFHINTIVQLVAVHTTRAPQLLWLLHAIVKLEDVSMVLKKNQAAVMKSFIHVKLLKEASTPDLVYLNSLVQLLATCAEKYSLYYVEEDELNQQLNTFAQNFQAIYGGANTVRTQLRHPLDEPYTDLDGDTELPLGPEFQEHVNYFIQRKKRQPDYFLSTCLFRQLGISGKVSVASLSEIQKLQQEQMDIKCLQVLRGIVHNEIVKLPPNWKTDVKNNKRKLKAVARVQNALNENDIMGKMLPLLCRNSDTMVREILAFLSVMLFAANANVQSSLRRPAENTDTEVPTTNSNAEESYEAFTIGLSNGKFMVCPLHVSRQSDDDIS